MHNTIIKPRSDKGLVFTLDYLNSIINELADNYGLKYGINYRLPAPIASTSTYNELWVKLVNIHPWHSHPKSILDSAKSVIVFAIPLSYDAVKSNSKHPEEPSIQWHIVAYDGSSVRRYRTRFINALSKRARAEELQRKYPKKWSYNRRVLSRIRSLHRKARSIIIDWCRKFAKEIVLKAKKHNYAIVLENLTHLHENMSKNKDIIAWKLSMLAYRKLQEAIVNKAIEYNVPIAFINPRNTSSTCPRCYTKLSYDYRLAICSKCGLIADRDVVGAVNIWLKFIHAYAREHGSPPRAPAMKDETRQSRRTRSEGMKKVIKNIQM